LLLLALLVSGGMKRAAAQEPPIEISEVTRVRPGEFEGPAFFSLAVDPQGNVHVGATGTSNVLRLSPRGDAPGDTANDSGCSREILSTAKADEDGIDFAAPRGIAVASDGTVYVNGTGNADVSNDNVVRISPDGTITELVNRDQLSRNDWNPSGIAIDEAGGAGTFVYAAGPAGQNPGTPSLGALVRINPDSTAQTVFRGAGQGVALDESGTLYVAAIDEDAVVRVPAPRTGACDQDGKVCDDLIKHGEEGCDGKTITLDQPYAMAVAGGILYVTGQVSGNVLRRALREDNVLGLPLCTEEIFKDQTAGIRLVRPRAIAADGSGNVYVAGGTTSDDSTLVWLRPNRSNTREVIAQKIEVMSDTGRLVFPHALAVDVPGNVYVSGSMSIAVFRVRTVTAEALCGNRLHDPDEVCDYRLDCCCSVSCTPQAGGSICRDSSGECDQIDRCDGVSPVCVDERKGAQTTCRPSAGECDVPEVCEGDVDCPPDRLLPFGTVCRPVSGSCDVPEVCEGAATCPVDLPKQVGDECSLTPRDVGEAETQCIETAGECSASRACLPRPRLGSFCVPADLPTLNRGCIASATCDGSGRCEAHYREPGEPCGSFCDNTVCRDNQCVLRDGGPPCGGRENCNDAATPGRECRLCGNRVVDEPFEQCDDGNADPERSDGCTAQCRFACDPGDPASCAQPFLEPGVLDPCRRTSCEPVDLDPELESEGFVCVTSRDPQCMACLDVRQDCPTPKPCQVVECVEHRCQYPSKEGRALATCAFDEPFPGDGTNCDARTGKNSRKAIASLERRENGAKMLLQGGLCQGGKPNRKALQQASERLKRAVLLANVLRSPFRRKISERCENMLTTRFETMRANIAASKKAGWPCPPGESP
jgi:sugar lactone lactonase YvrE